MKKKTSTKIRLIITVIAVMTTVFSFGQSKNEKKITVIPLQEAIEKKMLELKIFGAYDPEIFHEVIDRDGAHFGKCMAIFLKSNIDSLVLLKMDSGTELLPFDSLFQTMIVTKSVELPLYPGREYTTHFYAMCGQLHDAPPYLEATYQLGALSDSNTVKLAQYFDKNYIQGMIGQHALWAYTDKADFKELTNYGADSLSIALTAAILNDLSIETKLNPKKPKLEAPPVETIQVTKLMVYGIIALLLLLLTTSVYLIMKQQKKDETIG
jgi:hypothetical protein